MSTPTLGRTVGYGAISGAVAGGIGAVAQYWLVEPSIRAAIAFEEAGSATASHSDAGHTHGTGHTHTHAGEAVTRLQQVGFGLVTTLVVGVLIGIAFALVHRHLGQRITGRRLPGSALVLAGFGFLACSLVPAIVIPANPPAVGDPATVNVRTLTYIGTIVIAVAITAAVVTAARAGRYTSRQRTVLAAGVGLAGLVIFTWAVPRSPDTIPAEIPAGLIWNFRIASLSQLGLMWLFLAVAFGWLSTARETDSAGVRPPHTVSA